MDLKSKRRELQGANGAIGVVAGLGGFLTPLYSPAMGVFFAFAIWIIGATMINLLTDPPDRR